MEEISSLLNQPTSPQIPVNPPTVPPVNPLSPNKSVLIILLVVFLVILSSLITYFVVKSQSLPVSQFPTVSPLPLAQVSPSLTPDPMASWKTYEFPKMKLSLKLPPEWFVHNEEEWPVGSGSFSATISYPVDNPSAQNFFPDQVAMVSVVKQIGNAMSIADEAKERINMPSSQDDKTTTLITVADREAMVLKTVDGHSKTVILDGLGTGNYLMSINIFAETKEPKIKETMNVFDQILSTFKFN